MSTTFRWLRIVPAVTLALTLLSPMTAAAARITLDDLPADTQPEPQPIVSPGPPQVWV
jgi:hypothetical protein